MATGGEVELTLLRFLASRHQGHFFQSGRPKKPGIHSR